MVTMNSHHVDVVLESLIKQLCDIVGVTDNVIAITFDDIDNKDDNDEEDDEDYKNDYFRQCLKNTEYTAKKETYKKRNESITCILLDIYYKLVGCSACTYDFIVDSMFTQCVITLMNEMNIYDVFENISMYYSIYSIIENIPIEYIFKMFKINWNGCTLIKCIENNNMIIEKIDVMQNIKNKISHIKTFADKCIVSQ